MAAPTTTRRPARTRGNIVASALTAPLDASVGVVGAAVDTVREMVG
ncbi:MAG: hypothetical protein ABW328_22285 [Ilumatobacteraceae bacterium]